ncbi:MAG: hypothetical protein WC859_00410 [Elusimicrobiota bacterium]|jgi:hypothetical protein
MTGRNIIGFTLLFLAMSCAAEETPNQIRKRLGIPLGEPIPEEALRPKATTAPAKAHPVRRRKKSDKELDAAVSLVLSFFRHYNKGEAEDAWKLLSPEIRKRKDYQEFCKRSLSRYVAVQSSKEEPSADVAAVVGPKSSRVIEGKLPEDKIEAMQQWNWLNHSVMVYINPIKPVSATEPEMFVVKSIDDQLKIVSLPNY